MYIVQECQTRLLRGFSFLTEYLMIQKPKKTEKKNQDFFIVFLSPFQCSNNASSNKTTNNSHERHT